MIGLCRKHRKGVNVDSRQRALFPMDICPVHDSKMEVATDTSEGKRGATSFFFCRTCDEIKMANEREPKSPTPKT